MTDRPNNPDDLPEDDWEMSEPEVRTVEEPEPIDEVAAKLYAPPDTGDLQDWDIAPGNVETFDEPAQPENHPASPAFDGPTAFTPPHVAFEILEPLDVTVTANEDWGMHGAANDGWKMPEPVFQISEGNSLFGVESLSSTSEQLNQTAEVIPENLSDIYAPPETEEFVDIEGTVEESVSEGLPSDEIDFGNDSNEVPVLVEESSELAEPASQKKNWSILFWILIIVLLLLTLLTIGVIVVLFYSSGISA
jgi:hypothetical protein